MQWLLLLLARRILSYGQTDSVGTWAELNKQLVCKLYAIRCDSLDIWYTKWEIIEQIYSSIFTGILQGIGCTMQDACQQGLTAKLTTDTKVYKDTWRGKMERKHSIYTWLIHIASNIYIIDQKCEVGKICFNVFRKSLMHTKAAFIRSKMIKNRFEFKIPVFYLKIFSHLVYSCDGKTEYICTSKLKKDINRNSPWN